MHLPKYAALSDEQHETYEFLSSGPSGTIKKVVLFQELETSIYNLAFGDWDEATQRIKDDIRSNNADRDKVLATVASTLLDFIKYHPNAVIFAKGSIPSKTRLYQMGINSNWKEISQFFDVKGYIENKWEPFQKHKNYKAFIARAK